MSIALTEEHRDLAATVSDLLTRRDALGGNRALLEAPEETLPSWWSEAAGLGWLGLHLPEEHGGAGFGLEESVVLAEQLGRQVAPGPVLPSLVVSAVLARAGSHLEHLPGLADGSLVGAFGLAGEVTVVDDLATGPAGTVLGGGLADLLLVPSGEDVVVVRAGEGVAVDVPANLDPARRTARVTLDGAPCVVLFGARRTLVDLARLLLSAEAVGVAARTTELAAAYAKERVQFGRPIATFQAVKHHCANMAVATELATGAVWDAARAAGDGGDQLTYAAAVAAVLAASAANLCTNLNTQVHGGIAITWEHDSHLYVRRAAALCSYLDADGAAADLVDLTRRGVVRERTVVLPPEAEPMREEVRAFAGRVKELPEPEQLAAFVEAGYAVPHWPKPFGREAGAVEQIVVEQELKAAGLKKPSYGITSWNILTLVQHGTPEQVERWVGPALLQEVVWCQLFSEPGAGSDAAGIRTRGVRTEGGWIVNGQKVWTSGAHVSDRGLATVRTDPDAPKHRGITMMVIDMHAAGVTVRPLRQTSGDSEFNEVFFDDVFVPDSDVVGEVNDGWTVARATLGNESVSIGGDQETMAFPGSLLVQTYDAHPDRLAGGPVRLGRYIANYQALGLLNLRSAHRAVAGGEPGPEGAITKLMLSELGHDATAILASLAGPEAALLEGDNLLGGRMQLMHRALSIAGGTSEIKRNQIGERILGLPRDPLVS